MCIKFTSLKFTSLIYHALSGYWIRETPAPEPQLMASTVLIGGTHPSKHPTPLPAAVPLDTTTADSFKTESYNIKDLFTGKKTSLALSTEETGLEEEGPDHEKDIKTGKEEDQNEAAEETLKPSESQKKKMASSGPEPSQNPMEASTVAEVTLQGVDSDSRDPLETVRRPQQKQMQKPLLLSEKLERSSGDERR